MTLHAEQAPLPSDDSRSFLIAGTRIDAEPIAPGLHVVATPIGNLRDITLRALATLAAADTVLAEDTRVTKTLLAHYGIGTPLTAYHEHNAHLVRPQLLARLHNGARLALVSDAGTPLISDPGFRLVGEAAAAGVSIVPLPGPSALLAGLVVAGLPTDRFFFEGFLPTKHGPRRARLAELAAVPATLILYEAPQRIAATLADCADILGPTRQSAVARELTKHFETVRRGTLSELAAEFGAGDAPRGEIVLLIGQPAEGETTSAGDTLDERLQAALATHSIKDAAAIVSGETGVPRRRVYARALQIAGPRE